MDQFLDTDKIIDLATRREEMRLVEEELEGVITPEYLECEECGGSAFVFIKEDGRIYAECESCESSVLTKLIEWIRPNRASNDE